MLYASLEQDTQDDIAELDYKIYSDAESSIDRDSILAVPAVYAIDHTGMIRFDFVEANYKVRLPADELLSVAREIVQ